MPIILDLDQNTPEWHFWRKEHIGGSDAPAIMFVGFSDRYRLWQEKTGRIVVPEPAAGSPMDLGRRREGAAREAYSEKTGLFVPPVCLENSRPGERFMAASLDGWVEGERLVEIKCPSDARTHLRAREGTVERNYWIQMQHCMHVAEVPEGDYCSYFQEDLVIVPVRYDPTFVKEQLIPAEDAFWQALADNKYPFPDELVSLDLTQDEEALNLLRKYLDYRRMREEAQALEYDALAALKVLLSEVGSATTEDGVRLHWERKRGPIIYRNIPEIAEWLRTAGNLDEFRGAESLSLHVDRS